MAALEALLTCFLLISCTGAPGGNGASPIPTAVAVDLSRLPDAPVPSLCEHPAGNLVDGSLPGLGNNEGQVFLRLDVLATAKNGTASDAMAIGTDPSAAVAALQRLAALDSEILPPTYLTLRLIGQRKPDTINRFFAETDTDQLSPVWQELQIEALVYAGKKDEAGRLLQNLIDKRPSADLYIQAALLAANRKAPLEETVGYLTKAYQSGTQEQQSRAAVIAVLRNADNKNFAAARKWVEKIHAPDYAFDKAVLTASLDAEERKWPQAAAQVRRARAMTAKQGRFFDSSHLDRIETLTAARLSTPQQALAALNRLYTRAVKEKAEPDILGNILYQRALVYSDRLHQPEMRVRLKNGERSLRAALAERNAAKNLITLSGGVVGEQTSGTHHYQIDTPRLHYHPEQQLAETADPITLTSETSRTEAVGARWDMNTNHFTLDHNLKSTYEPAP